MGAAMSKYTVPEDHWEEDEPKGPPAWVEDTSAHIEIDVQLHNQGYQTDKKWTVHCINRRDEKTLEAAYAVKHRNKGNYWREGDIKDNAVDFVDLPLRVRKRVANTLNRELTEVTPDVRVIDGVDEPVGEK